MAQQPGSSAVEWKIGDMVMWDYCGVRRRAEPDRIEGGGQMGQVELKGQKAIRTWHRMLA
ncbi:MAG: hypothetical protein QM676_15220 [Novosphingobium sp.]